MNNKKTILGIIILLTLSFATASVFADTSTPTAPTGVSALAVSPTIVNVFWSAPSGYAVTGYKIEYKSSGGSYTTLVANTGNTATTYSHTGLTTDVTYSYKISAINSVGTGTASSEVTITPSSSSIGTFPGTPTGLTATPISSTQINLAWTAPSSNGGYAVTGYKIEYRIGSGSYTELVTTSNTATTYSHTGVTSGQVYVYRVYAVTSFGASEKPSPEVALTLKPVSATSAPGAPSGLSVTATSPTQTVLSWTAPSSNGGYAITGYKIDVKKGSATYTTLVATTGNSSTTYSHTGLTTGTTYAYKVYAINSIGPSTASPEASATPIVGSTSSSPAPPLGLSATSMSGTQINLSWAAPSNNGGSIIIGYKLEYKIGTSGTYSILVANTGNTATTYSHTGLTSGQVYVYRVSAINSVGSSNPSPEASTTPSASSTPNTNTKTVPGSPTSLSAVSASGTQINLSWAAPSNNGGSDITGYKIESKKGTGSYEVIVQNTGNTITTYSHTGLITATQYYYRISAINSIGTGSPSGEASSTPRETTSPVLTATAVSPTQIYLSWTAPSQTYKQSINGFKIEEKTGESYRIINDNTGPVTGYLVNNIMTGKSYTYAVSALFAAGASPRSNEVTISATTTSVAPAGFSTKPGQLSTSNKVYSDPEAEKKAQQDELQRRTEQAKEELLKKLGKTDSDKAKAAREEAQKANEKAIKDAAAARQKLVAEKQAELQKPKNVTATPTTNQKLVSPGSDKPKTLDEARQLAELSKQKALDKINGDTKKKDTSIDAKQKEIDAANKAAWDRAQKALAEYKAQQKK
ncbi:MAG: fibronectin type III domain-containing protein [Candidatus Nitrosotenuis sp.]